MASCTILDISNFLLDYLYSQLECTPNGLPCVKKLSVCEPNDVCCDYLSVYIDGIGGTNEAVDLQQCQYISTLTDIGIRVKLMRKCNDHGTCVPSQPDIDAVSNLFIDVTVLRSAFTRFVSRLAGFLGPDMTSGTTVQVLPLEAVCGDQCSGWIGGMIISMELCDDGSCEGDLTLPDRCDPCEPTSGTIIPTDDSIVPYN